MKIILIDDDPIVILLQRKLMEKAGFINSIESYGNGAAAIDSLKQSEEGAVFLILLDINMPGMSGWDFLDELNALNLPISYSVVIITSSIEQAEQDKSEEYEQVIDFWIKPFNLESFQKLREQERLKGFFL